MNRSRQEFSSRSKSFNSNGGGTGKSWKQKAAKRDNSWDKKKSRSFPNDEVDAGNKKQKDPQRDRTKFPDKLTNGFYQEEKSKNVKDQKPPNPKKSAVVNGKHGTFPSKKGVFSDKLKFTENEKTDNKEAISKHSTASASASKKMLKHQEQKNDTGQKRKNSDISRGFKKSKKEYHVESESDSDVDGYMERFFSELPEQDHPSVPEFCENPAGSSEDESEFECSESDSEDYEYMDSEEDGDVMSFKELLDYYGNNRDKKSKQVKDKHTKNQKEAEATCSSNITVTEKVDGKLRKKLKSPANKGWIEEDNDVGLVYEDSDKEQEVISKALVPVNDCLLAVSEEDEDYSPEELEEEEDCSDADELLSFEMEDESDDEYDSFDSEYSGSEEDNSVSDYDSNEYGSQDDHEFSSDYDSEDDLGEEDEDDEHYSYWDDSYDSDDDTDYEPMDYDDLFIGRGEARIYEIDDNNVSFNSEIDTAQIVELHDENGRKPSVGTSGTESLAEDEEKEKCPELVPIYDGRGRLIDSQEKLQRNEMRQKKSPTKATVKNLGSEKQIFAERTPTPESIDVAEHETANGEAFVIGRNLRELASFDDQMENNSDAEPADDVDEESTMDKAKRFNYRFYDSIDMRMALLILKDTLYFSGHLTLQPLIGGLEVMGCRLKRGECRNVYAVRGYHSLNLTPCFDQTGYSKEIMAGVLTRLEKHFQDIDLKELQKTFNPMNSVLVLLQADCNNKRITVCEKYLSGEMLFPKVEHRKKRVFFTSEYLLNAEFFTEHVDKGTSLYRSDPEWEKIELNKNSRIVVMGGKGAGKSTICQYLINKNVSKFKKVVLIDLDIGQPIQHIPETVSITIVNKPLLGVTTFESIPPAKCWLFGSLEVVSSPVFYIQIVRDLIKYCHQHDAELSGFPWIINTMGYVTGFGEELMAAVLRILAPTDVVQLVASNKQLAIPNFQHSLNANFINQFNFNILQNEVQEFVRRKANFIHHQFGVCYPRKGFTLNAPKRRILMLLSHLASILDESSSEWFNEVKPFCAPLSQLQVLVTTEDQTVAEDQLPMLLNATLVYLCSKTGDGLYECLGLGIVRGVDKNNNVYLLQSLPGEELAKVTVLAICSSSLPNTLFLQQSTRVQGSIPYVYNVD